MRKPIPIPPQSVVRLSSADRHSPLWKNQIGRVFRIGYYSPNDGLDCVWLVNDDGKYEQATDHEFLYRYFDVIHIAPDKNWYGRRRSQIPPIRRADLSSSGSKSRMRGQTR
jgi:hypothetical protein